MPAKFAIKGNSKQATQAQSLPDDMIKELNDVLDKYSNKETGQIDVVLYFKNILKNFAWWNITSNEYLEELKLAGLEGHKYITRQEAINIVTAKWCQGGREAEADECFAIFCKKNKTTITTNDLRAKLKEYIDIITEADMNELIKEAEAYSEQNQIKKDEFAKLFLS